MLCVLTFAVTFSAAADAQFRMAITAGTDFIERPSYEAIGSSFNNPEDIFEGLILEVLTRRIVGFGARGLIRFTEIAASDTYGEDSGWWFDWNGHLFLSAHLLGGGSLVDPFLEVGYGAAGRVSISSGTRGHWIEGDDGLWTYEWYEQRQDGVTNLSLFPLVAAGVSFDLSGFLIGARVSYRPIVNAVLMTPIEEYPLTRFHIDVFGGIAFGGHR